MIRKSRKWYTLFISGGIIGSSGFLSRVFEQECTTFKWEGFVKLAVAETD